MDEQRQQAYLNLIQTLLNCASDEETRQTLQANQELLKAGFVRTLVVVAENLRREGDLKLADRLKNLADHLYKNNSASTEDYFNCLIEILQAVEQNPSPETVFPLLEKHLDKLDENLAAILESWATNRLSQSGSAEEAQSISIIIFKFASSLRQFLSGSRANNIEIAITAYRIILKVFTPDTYPYGWATTKYNLGGAYRERVVGEKANNLESALACYRSALEVYTREAFPVLWASTQYSLGNVYRERMVGKKAQNLEEAIACYRSALEVGTREALPVDWAATQYNLGNVYRERIVGERAENLEEAIACYCSTLEVHTREASLIDWAATQYMLGLAYHDRIVGERDWNLKEAIAYYRSALEVYTREAFPVLWAATQNALGLAYGEGIIGERARSLEEAIACYRSALEVYTRTAFPVDWARTQNNLGVAYLHRIIGEKAENIEEAIACYRSALEVRTRKAFPLLWATTQNNLGLTYRERIVGEKAQNLEEALACYRSALEVYTRTAFPVDWAATQNNLGMAYIKRIVGEKAQNLEEAIACYRSALDVHTRAAFPARWATTQYNLGNAYIKRIVGEKAQNLEEAIVCYRSALEFYTCTAFPVDWAGTLHNLGMAYQEAQQLSHAYDAFAQAIDTAEFLRAEIILGSEGEEDKQKLAEQWNNLYQSMVDVCLKLGYSDQAVQYVESSKTRNLVELLATRTLDPKGKISEERRNELQQLRQRIRELDAENRLSQRDGKTKPDYTLVNQLRQRYNELYPFKPISFDQIQTLIDDHTAIIQWYISWDCFRAFIVTFKNQQPISWSSSAEYLDDLLKWSNEYIEAYNAPRRAETEAEKQELQQKWENSIASRLQDLADILHINEILSQIPASIDQLLLVPHSYLHLFPLHALPLDSKNCLLDRFSRGVRYTPSCQLLQQVQQQSRTEFQRFFAVQTPTEDLYNLDLGIVKAIANQFTNDSPILKRDKATKSALLNHPELQSIHSAFFFCHAYFNTSSALDSGLQLADGDLTLEEIIAHFDLKNCRLVTLAACETGLTDFTKITDEYIGLPSGFLLAGSTNVVCSLWPVNSLPTALLMLKFYEELQRQDSIAISLNTAQRWLRETTVQGFQTWLPHSQLSLIWLTQYFNTIEKEQGAMARPFQSPYHWAAFCAIGKGE